MTTKVQPKSQFTIQIIKELLSITDKFNIKQILLNTHMICCQCKGKYQSSPKPRYTATYYHHPIFDDYPPPPIQKQSKTPTIDKKNPPHQTTNNKNQQPIKPNLPQQKKQIKLIQQPLKPHQQKQTLKYYHENLQPKQHYFQQNKYQNAGNYNPVSNHSLLWFDQQKSIHLRKLTNCQSYGHSKQRKIYQLSSCSFYPQQEFCHAEQTTGKFISIQGQPNAQHNGNIINLQKIDTNKNTKPCQCNPIQSCKCNQHLFSFKQDKKQQQTQTYPINLNPSCNEATQTHNICNQCQAIHNSNSNNIQKPECKCYINEKNIKNIQFNKCQCNNGKCKCNQNCTCGISCQCCPKFMAYPTCKCGSTCQCGTNCQCGNSCKCCFKYKKQPLQTKKTVQSTLLKCGCSPECGCTSQCSCGPQCKCFEAKKNHYQTMRIMPPSTSKKSYNPHFKTGLKTTKIPKDTIKKSQPVFKSIRTQKQQI